MRKPTPPKYSTPSTAQASAGRPRLGEDRGRKAALEGDVVDGHHGLRRPGPCVAEPSRGEAGLPVVAMDDVGHEGIDRALADIGRRTAKCCEALPVVRPVGAVGSEIGAAGPIEQLWRVEDDEVQPSGGPGDKPGLGAEQALVALEDLGRAECAENVRVARQHHPHLDIVGGERLGQGARDIGKAAGLDQREDFGSDREDTHRVGYPSRSIIVWVIRQMPLSVRRKRRASSSGSSPTTSPSGMRTPRSITTLLSRAERPMST